MEIGASHSRATAAAQVAKRRAARGKDASRVDEDESQSSESEDETVKGQDSDSEPDMSNMTIGDESLMTSTLDVAAAAKSGVENAGEAALPVESGGGWWGFDERPLEPLVDRPLQLRNVPPGTLDDATPPADADADADAAARRAAAAAELDTLLKGHDTVSSRLVRWMEDEGIADLDGVTAAMTQMHTVALSPPPPPPGGFEEFGARKAMGAASRAPLLDDGDVPLFGPQLVHLLHARVDQDVGGALRRVRVRVADVARRGTDEGASLGLQSLSREARSHLCQGTRISPTRDLDER